MMLKIKHVAVAALCMALASVWAQSAKPFASMANGELVSEQDLSDYLDRRIDLRLCPGPLRPVGERAPPRAP